MSNADFKIKFDSQRHQISANVLVSSLVHMTSVIQVLNTELNAGKKVDITIKALEKGSFLIHIGLIETALDGLRNLFTKENLDSTSELVTGFVGLIELHRFLRGKREKKNTPEGNKVKIENNHGKIIYVEKLVYNTYNNNPTVPDALSESFKTMQDDDSITGYEVKNKEEETLIRVEHEEFDPLSKKSERLDDDEKIITQVATLSIVRVSFDSKLKWEFYFEKNKITASIDDPSFHKRVDAGEAFAKGDGLKVELEIRQRLDPSINTFVNRSYRVVKIIDHMKKGELPNLDFPN